jgi:glycosyltransferase involved in cell wall biosynthesis
MAESGTHGTGDAGSTSNGRTPRVSIGMPVYNSERTIEQALDSVLAQTFKDWELHITDNASTDRTEAICRQYAARDSRVHYHRNPQNVGLSGNYTKSFELCRGEYFKWLAGDDALSPELLGDCVAVLDENPNVVMVIPQPKTLEADGSLGDSIFGTRSTWGHTPSERFRQLVDEFAQNNGATAGVYMYGLMRSIVTREQTRLIGDYLGADCVIMTEVALAGDIVETRGSSLYMRVGTSAQYMNNWDVKGFLNWYNPHHKGRLKEFVFSHRRNLEYSRAALNAKLPLPTKLELATYALRVPVLRLQRRLMEKVTG